MKISRSILTVISLVLLVSSSIFGEKPIKNQTIVVNLLSPISTKTSKEGDTFNAMVLEPTDLQGSMVEGKITKVKAPEPGSSEKPHLQFGFTTLTVGETTYKIQADLQEVTNSKGVAKVDEEGEVIAKGNGAKKAMFGAGGAGMGALAGGMLGGGVGALIGGAAGGALGYVVALEMTAPGQNMELFAGSHFTLLVSSKGVVKK